MGAETTSTLICLICCLMFAPFVLQTVGLFTPNWVSNSTCGSIGLVYSCCSGDDGYTCRNTDGGDELDVRALGLQATSFSIMFMTMVCICCGICCSNADDDDNVGICAALGGCCFMLFPVAGLFSVIGCILVAMRFSSSDLGYSFVLCLTSGCFILLVTFIGCWCQNKASKGDDMTSSPIRGNTTSHMPYQYNEGRSARPLGGGYVSEHATVQAVTVHDHESGSITVFMSRMNIARIVRHLKHDN